MQKTEEIRDRVVLVGLSSPVLKKEENADEGTMEELAALCLLYTSDAADE